VRFLERCSTVLSNVIPYVLALKLFIHCPELSLKGRMCLPNLEFKEEDITLYDVPVGGDLTDTEEFLPVIHEFYMY
jgi:hypothetical protein